MCKTMKTEVLTEKGNFPLGKLWHIRKNFILVRNSQVTKQCPKSH